MLPADFSVVSGIPLTYLPLCPGPCVWALCHVNIIHYCSLKIYSAQKKKLSAPEQGQNFPQMIIIQWCKINLAHINRKKDFCRFRGGKFLFLSTVATLEATTAKISNFWTFWPVPAGTLCYIYVVFMFGGYAEIRFDFMLECLVFFNVKC